MNIESLKENIMHSKEIVREIYVFTNQLEIIKELEAESKAVIDSKEKKLLKEVIESLFVQLKILNKSVPDLIQNIGFFKKFPSDKKEQIKPKTNLVQIKYKPAKTEPKVSLTINEADRKIFLENLSKSNLSIYQLKKKFSSEKPIEVNFGRANSYAKISNKIFRGLSNKLAEKNYLVKLNKNLRKMNSPFIVTSYASMILFTVAVTAIFSLLFLFLLMFYNVSFAFPFLSPVEESFLLRFSKVFWIIFALPLSAGLLMYFYPFSEGKNLGSKINQELPFIAIHMSAISMSGIEPLNIFRIILKNKEYKNTNIEFKKLMNLINFQGYNLVSALKKIAVSSPSSKLRDLFNGMATAITSGGDLHGYLSEHAKRLLFDYRLEREKYTKTSETFMDIYISIVIAAPMILLILFVIMGSTGMSWLGLDTNIIGFLIILIIALLNAGFLIFLNLKQPTL